MKLIIDISEDDYECSKQRWMRGDSVHKMDYCVSKGTPLDDVKAEIFENAIIDASGDGFIFLGRLIKILDKHTGGEDK